MSYRNYGSCVDLFAGVESGNGTSGAAADTAGVAALFLQLYPGASPIAVLNELVDKATVGAVTDPGGGSPNRLLYSRPPAFTLGILGPSSIGPNSPCTWNSLRLGGQPPYTTEWRRNGTVVSTGDSYSVLGEPSSFSFDLYVWDGVGRSAFATRSIIVDPFDTTFLCGS